MKTTLDMPDRLFRRAKARASERGITLKALINTAVEQSLAVAPRPWSAVLASLPKVPAGTLEAVRARVAEADAADLASWNDPGP